MQKGMKAGTEMGAHGTVIHECQKKKKKEEMAYMSTIVAWLNFHLITSHP